MRVAIIDFRKTRREAIVEWLSEAGHEPIGTEHFEEGDARMVSNPELVLLHVGVEQNRNEVNSAIERFGGSVWTIGYTGSASVAAVAPQHTRYQQFPPDVPGDSFPVEFRNTVAQVLMDMGPVPHLSTERFKEIVSGFSPLLEAKLSALISKITDGAITNMDLDRLEREMPDTFASNRELFEPSGQRKAQLKESRVERVRDARELRGLFWPAD
jgi:hypothetical protein